MAIRSAYALAILLGALTCALPIGGYTRAVTSSDLLRLHDIDALSMSPNGRYIVFQVHQANAATNTYATQWLLIDTRTKKQRTMVRNAGEPIWDDTGAGEWLAYAPVWSPDSTAFYYVRKDRRHPRLHRVALAGSDTPVTLPTGDVVNLLPDGAGKAYVAIARPSLTTKRQFKGWQKNGMLFAPGIPGLQGDPINPPRALPAHEEDVVYGYDLRLGDNTIRPQPVVPSSYGVPENISKDIKNFSSAAYGAVSPDGLHEAFGVTLEEPGKSVSQGALYVAPIHGGKAVRVSTLGDPVGHPTWSSDGRYIYFTRITNYSDLNLFVADMVTKKSRQLTRVAAYLYNCSFATAQPMAACRMSSFQRPEDVALIHLSTGKIDMLSNVNAHFNGLDKTGTEKLVWTNKDNDRMFGVLTYPRGYRAGIRYPLIITTYRAHGFLRGAVGDEYPISLFAANGFFVFSLDVWLAYHIPPIPSGAQQPFATTLLHWQSPLDSIEQVIGSLSGRGLIDRRRVGISGLSEGAEITNYAISHANDFAAAVTSGGSAKDPFFYYLKNEAWDRVWKAWDLDGPPYEANFPKWKALSPALNADHIMAPLLMNAPDSEYVLALQQYWEMRDHKRPVEMWIFGDEGHVKHQPAHRLTIYNRNLDWFRYWLQNVRDPDPAKREQYRRWDMLRLERDALKDRS